jgi:oligopeptide/dipeptide ABC transporter ATP-binding protein
MSADPLLELDGLGVRLGRRGEDVSPVDGVTLTVARGEALGLVGESGCGKSLTLRAIMGLLPRDGRVTGHMRIALDGDDPAPYDPGSVRGRGIGMVFQEPMTALNPTMRVGDLIAEPMRVRGTGRREAQRRAIELMGQVGIPDAARRSRAWPHELSGGLRQRTMLAAALATDPKLLLCDEPTTALDVCVQDQILGLLSTLVRERGMAMLFVTHDLAVVAELCDRVAVMYAGRVVETGTTDELLARPAHPYTRALLRAAPSLDRGREPLVGIPGRPPDPRSFPPGCRFADRCEFARDDCRQVQPELVPAAAGPGRLTACLHAEELLGEREDHNTVTAHDR